MERSQVLDASCRRRAFCTMGQLKLYGMRTAYDEIITTAVKRQHEPQQIIGDLLATKISENEPTRRHRSEPGGEWRARSNTR